MSYNGAFKNYRSQLNGWAIAQALDYWRVNGTAGTVEDLQATAKQIGDYAYQAENDFEDIIKRLGDVLKVDEDPIAKADMLIGELEFLKEQMGAHKPQLVEKH